MKLIILKMCGLAKLLWRQFWPLCKWFARILWALPLSLFGVVNEAWFLKHFEFSSSILIVCYCGGHEKGLLRLLTAWSIRALPAGLRSPSLHLALSYALSAAPSQWLNKPGCWEHHWPTSPNDFVKLSLGLLGRLRHFYPTFPSLSPSPLLWVRPASGSNTLSRSPSILLIFAYRHFHLSHIEAHLCMLLRGPK